MKKNSDIHKTTIRAFLDVRWSSGDPSKISEFLGMEPDEAWAKGDVIPVDKKVEKLLIDKNKPRKRKYSCWTIKANVRKPTCDVEIYIKNIIRKIKPIKERIVNLPKNTNLMLRIWMDVYPEDTTPGVGLGLETMKFLSDIRCELDVDISVFCLEGDDKSK